MYYKCMYKFKKYYIQLEKNLFAGTANVNGHFYMDIVHRTDFRTD